MKLSKVILVVLGVVLLTGCGDQFWCGDDGCNASSSYEPVFGSSKKV